MQAVEYARTTELDALADAAHTEWAIHWAACKTRRRDSNSWCQACDHQIKRGTNRCQRCRKLARKK